MPNATLQAITAAGVVYQLADFADPHLTQPTALTVTADGRVFGHLADWNSAHIGFDGQRVTPPHSRADYRYFHQGVVRTNEGDLPVGKITLGTGHAALGENANTAAAHYDNTGSVVAAVRAGEDQYGIWLSGRLVPGVTDAKVDELRLSGVSGDWRGIDGHLELVAALAVNVPGFPLPRTEQLVAAGGFGALVAAGVVLPAAATMPKTPAELDAHITAAMDRRDRVTRRGELTARMSLVASASKRDRLTRQVAAVRRDRARDKVLVAAGGVMPGGDGAAGDHSSDGMIALLPSEADTQRLAVDGGEPADEMHLTLAYFPDAAEMGDPNELAQNVVTSLGGPVQGQVSGHAIFNPDTEGKEPCAVYLVQAPGLSAANQAFAPAGDYDSYTPHIAAAYNPTAPLTETGPVAFDRVRVSQNGQHTDVPLGAVTAAGPAAPKAPTAPTAPGQARQPGKKGERRVASQEGARRYGVSVGDLIGQDVANAQHAVAKGVDDIRQRAGDYAQAAGRDLAQAITGKPAPAAPKSPAAPAPQSGTVDAPTSSSTTVLPSQRKTKSTSTKTAGKSTAKKSSTSTTTSAPSTATTSTSSTQSAEFPDAPAPRAANNSGDPNSPMEEDETPLTGARGGKLVDFADGVATYDDGTQTDGKTWTDVGESGVAQARETQAANAAKTTAPQATTTPASDPAPRLANNGGTTRMEEDEAPTEGRYGGKLVSYKNGVATYDDGTSTDGSGWKDDPTPLTNKPFTGPAPAAPAPAPTSLGTKAAVGDPNKKKKDLVAAAIARINALDGRPKG